MLNQDASLDSTWCEAIQRRFDSDGSIGIVGSKIFHPNRLTIQHAGGYLERPRLVGRHFGHHRSDDRPLLHAEREVEFVTAAAMAIRLSALVKTGCFQEIFSPGYYEDVDLCDRIHEAGWKILFCPEAIAIHAESASIDDRVRRLTLSNRARLIYALRWLVDDRFRDEFSRAERQHINSDLSADERRALTAAYLELLLILRRALNARVGRDRLTPAVTSELFEMLVGLRDLILAKKWAVSSPH
jgi:GT2 family glycosyltransferase